MKTGFVYIWYDRKHKRYYIGSHWGQEDDGYICSSRWMRNAYRKRPHDFSRRILSRVDASRGDLLAEEHNWLQKIPNSLLGKKYYNLTNHLNGHWSSDEQKALSIREKLSLAQKKNFEDPEYRARFIETRKNLPPQSTDTKEKRRRSMIGKNVGRLKTEKYYESLKNRKHTNSEEHRQRTKELGVFKRLNSTIVTCLYCEVTGNPGNMARYHNDKCKHRIS